MVHDVLWGCAPMNMMISYQELVRTFLAERILQTRTEGSAVDLVEFSLQLLIWLSFVNSYQN